MLSTLPKDLRLVADRGLHVGRWCSLAVLFSTALFWSGSLGAGLPGLAVAAGRADAAEALVGFHAGKQFHRLRVDRDHVALRAAASAGLALDLDPASAEAFAAMGMTVVPRSQIHSAADVVGYPIWFGAAPAVGVLTHEIVVRLEPGATVEVIKKTAGFADLERTAFGTDVYRAKFDSPMTALKAANDLYRRKGVLYAHPNFLVGKTPRSGPAPQANAAEPLYWYQWHLENTGQFGGAVGADIHIQAAWQITRGSEDVVIAVIDGGHELKHPDLAGAYWRNPGELAGNQRDDDGNGYVDDLNGWNFATDSPDVGDATLASHGVAVAGLVAARLNGRGVAGVCPKCTVMPITIELDSAAQVLDDAAAFYYALDAGAAVITNSWGYAVGVPTTDVVTDAIRQAALRGRRGKGTVILFAMNNLDRDDCQRPPDISALAEVVAVSAADDLDRKVPASAWGDCMELLAPTRGDLGRPGITTTDLVGRRGNNSGTRAGQPDDPDFQSLFGGTSAATPIAAGVFGLMLAVDPGLTRDEVIAVALATADKVHPESARYSVGGFSNHYGYGRINAAKALSAARDLRRQAKATPTKPSAVRR